VTDKELEAELAELGKARKYYSGGHDVEEVGATQRLARALSLVLRRVQSLELTRSNYAARMTQALNREYLK